MRKSTLATVLGLALIAGGCADMTSTQQQTLSGAAIGTAGGLAIGAIAGDAGMGALIGAGAGAAGGYLYNRNQESKQAAYERGVQAGRSGAGT
jgi:hypothetical protein